MKIIDKYYDLYDHFQEYNDSIVFDRRGSFLLTKQMVCDAMFKCNGDDPYHWLLIQCGASFWLFLATVTKKEKRTPWQDRVIPTDYKLEFIKSWKDYEIPSQLIKVSIYSCPWSEYNRQTEKYNFVRDAKVDIVNYIYSVGCADVSTYKTCVQTKTGWDTIKYNIPLLKGIGIGNLVDPLEFFCAIEEYFSMKKTASERTEPLGATNDDKIIMHGFDTKTSFRGQTRKKFSKGKRL